MPGVRDVLPNGMVGCEHRQSTLNASAPQVYQDEVLFDVMHSV